MRQSDRVAVPAWLRHCKDNVVELLYALDVGNSVEGKITSELLGVYFKTLPYADLVDSFK